LGRSPLLLYAGIDLNKLSTSRSLRKIPPTSIFRLRLCFDAVWGKQEKRDIKLTLDRKA